MKQNASFSYIFAQKNTKMRIRISKIILLLVLICGTNNNYAQTKEIEVKFTRNKDKTVDFYYEKNVPGTVFLKMFFSDVRNATVSDYEQILSFSSGSLKRITPLYNDKDISFQYKFSYIKINPKPKVDSTFQYILPFKKGKKIQIFETKNITETYFGNKNQENWKAYLVKSNVPDTVCAMRKGIVVNIINKYETDTSDVYKYTSKQNSIKIEHADGTYSVYNGFKKNSFLVKLGDEVYPNTPLGFLDLFNGKTYNLHFFVNYVRSLDVDRDVPLNKLESAYNYLTPYFFTAEGNQKIINKNTYTTEVNDAIIQKELTKREIKKLKKA
jgi:hypothetical protein